MRKETLKALKAVSRREQPLPPPKIIKNKKTYSRHPKHRTGLREESGPFFMLKFKPPYPGTYASA